ncbi:hypothetical protein HU200_061496 [Digitaria exilis]|uniref:Sec-independent protein translocase protein TATC, chloroplastic n=1 Tax=Digitaria exilis TaxID=1010633 RepID=A0A835ACJ2_9POAL|nr:hypothetical protein HU200_061496 [Digitaria exilis]
MGGPGALRSHPQPQLHPGGVLISQGRPLPRPRNLISAAAAGAQQESFRRLCCAAVNGDGGPREVGPPPQREKSPSSGPGASLEDSVAGPPVAVESRSFGGLSQEEEQSVLYNFLYPSKELLPDDKEMSIFDHLEELRERIFISVLAVGAAILGCFAFSKDLILLLEAPVSGYCGLLLGSPIILYEIIAFVLPGLTRDERKFLGPIVLGSSVLFYLGIFFSYTVLSPAALNFFVNYADGAVESLWSIDQYFEFILVLMFSTGLSFQVPVIQLLLGQVGLVSGDQMLSIWRYVVVGAVVAAAVLTPSTDPLTQMLLAGPLLGLYLGGAWMVKLIGR